MNTCFVCLEESATLPMKKLCQTCAGSTICQRCELIATTSTNPDVLTMCPICRNNVSGKTQLVGLWQPFMLAVWWFMGVKIPVWQQTLVGITSYEYVSRACRTINETTDNGRVSMLLKRWNILNKIIHVPYLMYLWYRHETMGDNEVINAYMASHFMGPITILFVLKFLFRMLGVDLN
jgi:hypothetical protein